MSADAARFRNASADSRHKLIVINKRFSEDADSDDLSSSVTDRRRHTTSGSAKPSDRHVNFGPIVTVDLIPPPPTFVDRSISVPDG